MTSALPPSYPTTPPPHVLLASNPSLIPPCGDLASTRHPPPPTPTTTCRSDPAIVAKADTLLRSACDRNAMGMGARSNGEKDGDPYDLYRPAVAARPGSSGGEHAVVQSCSYSDPEEEARVIAEHIMKWNRVGAGASPAVPLREIAVLYRNRALSLPLEQELARWGIRFTVVGGQPFWEYKVGPGQGEGVTRKAAGARGLALEGLPHGAGGFRGARRRESKG